MVAKLSGASLGQRAFIKMQTFPAQKSVTHQEVANFFDLEHLWVIIIFIADFLFRSY